MAKKLYYKIGEACKSLDIQPYVLRYWETEFPALKPNKSKSGQRVYSERDLRVIRRIKELLYDEGYTIAGAKKKLDSEGPVAAEAAADAETEAEAETTAGAKIKAVAEEVEDAAAEAESAPPAKPRPAKKKAAAAKPKKSSAASAAAAAKPPAMSPRVRKAVQKALKEAHDLLAVLDKKAG